MMNAAPIDKKVDEDDEEYAEDNDHDAPKALTRMKQDEKRVEEVKSNEETSNGDNYSDDQEDLKGIEDLENVQSKDGKQEVQENQDEDSEPKQLTRQDNNNN